MTGSVTVLDLPPRYDEAWGDLFLRCIGPRLATAGSILDIGSGRRPAIPPPQRPAGSCYVGVDISRAELLRAPPRSYDETMCGDLMVLNEDLMGRFDLIVSLNVFEHLPDPTIAVTHLRSYLTARGRLVSLLSGRYSCFGVANRLLPARVGSALAAYVTDRQRDTVFPAYYRECYYDGLVRLFSAWRRTEIYPQFRGEIYFRSLRSARATYLAYEGLMYHTMRRNLATHYFVVADR